MTLKIMHDMGVFDNFIPHPASLKPFTSLYAMFVSFVNAVVPDCDERPFQFCEIIPSIAIRQSDLTNCLKPSSHFFVHNTENRNA